MATWDLLAGPSTAAPTTQLTSATGRRLTFRLTEPSEIAFSIDGRNDEAYDVVELATDVHALRDGVPLMTARVLPTTDDFDDDDHVTGVTCRDTRALLTRRLTRSARNWVNEPAASAATSLLNEMQASPYTSLGITVPALAAPGATVTREVKVGVPLLAELQAIAGGVEGGSSVFDWDLSPGWPGAPPGWDGAPSRTAQLWAPGRGRDLTGATDRSVSVVLDYTARRGQERNSAVAKVRRSFDPTTYANVVTVTGGMYQTTVQVPSLTAVDSLERMVRGLAGVAAGNPILTTTLRTDTRGTKSLDDDFDEVGITIPTTPVTLSDGRTVWDVGSFAAAVAEADLNTQAAVDQRAAQLSAELATITPTYEVTLGAGFWQGPQHIWLGDKVRLILDSGRLNEDVSLRVQAITVDPGDDGAETVSLTVGPTSRQVLSTLLTQARRIAALERAR